MKAGISEQHPSNSSEIAPDFHLAVIISRYNTKNFLPVIILVIKLRILCLAVFFSILFFPIQARAGFQGGDCDQLPAVEWREARTRSFAVLYPLEYERLGQWLSAQHGDALDQEYARFEPLFETPLSRPISIRIYPDITTFSCLNAGLEEVVSWSTHTHIGAREIALFGGNILADFPSWSHNFANEFRYELAILFAEQAAGGQAPPGLKVAIGHFAQDPSQTIGLLRLDRGDWLEPTHDWDSLWEETFSQEDFISRLQATSILAYLVDVYGWAPFMVFLKNLAVPLSYRQSLSQAYGKDLAGLEEEWRAYYPGYFQGRWQAHILYNYDLSPFEALVRDEKYVEADSGLQAAIAFLEKTYQADRLEQAYRLLLMAKKGQEAGNLMAQSRQAFHAGDYTRSLELVEQAEQRYIGLGNRARLDQIASYRDRVRRILALRAELTSLQEQVNSHWNTIALAARLVSLGRSLSALGDADGLGKVRAMAKLVETRQRDQHSVLSIAVLAVALGLLGFRLSLQRRQPPPEAQL
jgi:hypothetical protein